MRTRSELIEKINEMVGVVGEGEIAFAERNVARIVPVGDVDVVILKKRLHGVSQQRREMSRHRRHQQHARLRGSCWFLEMQQRPESCCVRDLFHDLAFTVSDPDFCNAVGRARITDRAARDQLKRGAQAAQHSVRYAGRKEIEVSQCCGGPTSPWSGHRRVVLKRLIHHPTT